MNLLKRMFTSISSIPKATVYAAIGLISLGLGISILNLMLAISVLAVLLLDPTGAIMIDNTYKRLWSYN